MESALPQVIPKKNAFSRCTLDLGTLWFAMMILVVLAESFQAATSVSISQAVAQPGQPAANDGGILSASVPAACDLSGNQPTQAPKAKKIKKEKPPAPPAEPLPDSGEGLFSRAQLRVSASMHVKIDPAYTPTCACAQTCAQTLLHVVVD